MYVSVYIEDFFSLCSFFLIYKCVIKKKMNNIYTPTKVKHHPIFLSIYFFYINTVKTIK